MTSHPYPNYLPKRRERASMLEIRAFLNNCLIDLRPLRAHAFKPARYLSIRQKKGIKSVRWHTYHMDAHYAWERTFRPRHGRE